MIAEFVAARIDAAVLVEEPWRHIVVQALLPADVYEDLREKAQATVLGRQSDRRMYELVDGEFHPAAAALLSELVGDVLEEKLGFRGTPKPRIVRDLPGYSYPAHPDIPDKAGTLQLYLTAGAIKGYGTRLHLYPHGAPVSEVPFRPNLAYAFKRTASTFHSVGPVGDVPRWSFLVPFLAEEAV